MFEQQPGVAIREEIRRHHGLVVSSRVRHPGATIDAAADRQLDPLPAATCGDADLMQPLDLGR